MIEMAVLLAGAAVAYSLWRLGDLATRHHRNTEIQGLLGTFAPAVVAAQPLFHHDGRRLALRRA